MNEIITKGDIKIENMIYEIRGREVILDSDLAKLYHVETKRINETVRRNSKRFPPDFYFQLTSEENESLRSQIATSKQTLRGGTRYLPSAFTEYGIIMLSSLLKSDIAIETNKLVIKAFVTMRKYLKEINYDNRISNIETKIIEHDNKIDLILDKLSTKEENNHIFYEGQIYDAYSLLMNILGKAKKEIIIIDNYAGKELFDIIKDIKVNIRVYTENIDNIAKKKYEQQYSNLTIINTNIFHDRFILIDNKILYHSGASFKDLGKKCFCITKMEDSDIINNLSNKLKLIK